MSRIDPFTRTPGVAGDAFINMHHADAIIENFDSDRSSKYIYKIVGLRGSGKSVEYRWVINAFRGRGKPETGSRHVGLSAKSKRLWGAKK